MYPTISIIYAFVPSLAKMALAGASRLIKRFLLPMAVTP